MAYRFNPPPNWPIEDANWSPPPGWQPDPSWGPAPDGWNFWVASQQAPAAPAAAPVGAADDATRVDSTGEQAPGAPVPAAEADDATRLVSTGPRDGVAGSEEPAAPVTGDQGAVEPLAEEQPAAQDSSVHEPSAQEPAAPATLGADEASATQAPAASQAPVGQYGTMNPYGAAAPQEVASSTEETHGRHTAAPEDDSTHVAGSGQRAAVQEAPEQNAAPLAAGTGPQQGQVDEVAAEATPTPGDGASETAEYAGPDLEAGLAQQAPYETAEPVAGEGYGAPAAQDSQTGEGSGAGYGTAAAGGALAAGGVAAGAGAAGAGAAHGAGDDGRQGSGQAAAAPEYGQGGAAQGYGQASPAPGYGQASPAPGYGQSSPAPGYGQGSPAPGYGQASPASGYGQGSAAEYPGQGSASDYPAQGYGQASPGVETGSGWTASTGAGEPPKKGFIRRFWWLGCLLVLLLVLVLLIAGGIWLFSRGDDKEAGGGGQTTTSQEATTDGGESSEEATTEEATTEEEPTEEAVTPSDMPTIDASAKPVDIVGPDGSGTMAVHMTYVPADKLPSSYGGTVDPGKHGDYLVMTAKMTVTEGTMGLSPGQFTVVTPYGGEVTAATPTYGLKGSGLEGDAPRDFKAGDEYTIKVLFDVKRASGLTLNATTYADDYTWEVPA